MTVHLVTSTRFDFEEFRRRQDADEGPGHVADALARTLGASVHQPGDAAVTRGDRLLARIIGQPEHWAIARSLGADIGPDDLVYATGEDAGLPIAIVNLVRRRQARVAVYFLAPDRIRPRTIGAVIGRMPGRFLAVTGTEDKVEKLRRRLGSGVDGVVLADEQTDVDFFRPPTDPAVPSGERPLVMSCGLEQRDYVSLAAAVGDMDVDAKVCAASPNFTAKTRLAMPDTLPPNLEIRSFDFPELRRLYQTAAVAVIALLPNNYSAGLTVMLEAIACGTPVIITESTGLAASFIDEDLVIGTPPGDAEAIRRAINGVLADPDAARDRAHRARSRLVRSHTSQAYIESLATALQRFAQSGRVAA